MVPTRTQMPSIGTGGFKPKILLASAMAFHSSLVWPPGMSLSIHAADFQPEARRTPPLAMTPTVELRPPCDQLPAHFLMEICGPDQLIIQSASRAQASC